jgi:hypothetical protein
MTLSFVGISIPTITGLRFQVQVSSPADNERFTDRWDHEHPDVFHLLAAILGFRRIDLQGFYADNTVYIV